MNPRSPLHRQSSVRSKTYRYDPGGLTQLSLVEHALCHLDSKQSLSDGYVHECGYHFQDKNRNKKTANVRIACPFGLSPNDEFFLWGLLHLALAQDDPTAEFSATPHYCLRRLGVVHQGASQGKRYQIFRDAIRRLSGVVYQNDHFYDPIRGEHRDVAFGLLKYSLPLDSTSARTWRFVFDQQFFEFCFAARGSLEFDLDLYRQLDFAGRRLLLFLQKLFWRRDDVSIDVAHLAVNVLGFTASIPTCDLKAKVRRVAEKLLRADVIRLPDKALDVNSLFAKRAKGRYDVTFHRGPYFDLPEGTRTPTSINDSPCYDPLKAVGFDDDAIRRILSKHKPTMVQQWADITLAAVERKLVKKDPKAFFHYYLRRATKREVTPPDWWLELRKKEERKRWEEERNGSPLVARVPAAEFSFDEAFRAYLEGEAHETLDRITTDLTRQFRDGGQGPREAADSANRFAVQHLRNRFLKEHPEYRAAT